MHRMYFLFKYYSEYPEYAFCEYLLIIHATIKGNRRDGGGFGSWMDGGRRREEPRKGRDGAGMVRWAD